MQPELTDLTPCFEATLAANIVDLTTEFRNYDAADLVALIKLDKIATLRSLLDGECEMLFKPSTMQFGGHAEVFIGWNVPPSIRLSMTFRHLDVELYYRLTLEAADAHVQIDLIRFEPADVGRSDQAERLERAFSAARCERSSAHPDSFRQET